MERSSNRVDIIRMKWCFNRERHFRQLKSLGLKKALAWFKGMREAQPGRLLRCFWPITHLRVKISVTFSVRHSVCLTSFLHNNHFVFYYFLYLNKFRLILFYLTYL